MGRLGIVYRHDDGKTTQVDTRAWDFAPWVKEKLGRAVRHQRLLRYEPTEEERTRIREAIAAGRIEAASPEAYVTRRKAEALLDLLDDLDTLGEVLLEQGLVVLQPKGIDIAEVSTTRLDEEERAKLLPRLLPDPGG